MSSRIDAGVVPVVEMEAVNKYFGALHVLKDINLTVREGEVVAVIGPSGSGKSTLCRTINRLEPIDSGRIYINGSPMPAESRGVARLRREVGMVFQQFNLFHHKTVLENVTVGPIKSLGISRRDATETALRLLRRVGVADQADKLPGQLSGGQQQRVAIARSLAMEPRLILFDEPTSALDPEMVSEVLDVMRGLAQEGMTMFVVTHELEFARSVADRILFMDQGEVLVDAEPEAFFDEPGSDRAEQFLAKVLHH